MWIGMMLTLVGMCYHVYEHYVDRIAYNEKRKERAAMIWETCKQLQPDAATDEYINCEKADFDSRMNVYSRSKEDALSEVMAHFNPVIWMCGNDQACSFKVWNAIQKAVDWTGPILLAILVLLAICTITVCGPVIALIRFIVADREAKLSQQRIATISKASHPHISCSHDQLFTGDVHKLS
jgi:hypothetical protein